jgi:ribosomal protein S18 acetylase RimI-like enzyme
MTDAEIVALIARMHADSWRGAYRGIYPDRFLDFEADSERIRFWRRRVPQLRTIEGELFLATLEGAPAGFLCIEVGEERLWGAFVDNLHVLPAFQEKGVGAALVERAAEWARQRHQRQLYLFVLEDNLAARHFYERTGWRVAGREMHDLVNEGEAPVLRLVKPIGDA